MTEVTWIERTTRFKFKSQRSLEVILKKLDMFQNDVSTVGGWKTYKTDIDRWPPRREIEPDAAG